jgi:two-component system, OmpR family, sensor histidine kinase ResE
VTPDRSISGDAAQEQTMTAATLAPDAPQPSDAALPSPPSVFHDPARAALVATVSHELRSPLSVIMGYVHTLLDGVARDAEQNRESLQIIAASAEKLSVLVSDLTDAARMDAGAFQLQCEPVRIERIALRVVANHRVLAPCHHLTVDAAPGLPLAEADPTRIEQVITNLVENAVKYSPAGGRITVRIRAGDGLTVSVIDEGAGIDPAAIGRLFEPFFRAGGSLERRTHGVGLGLYICRRLIEAHGGQIRAESTSGTGSIFSFTVPIVDGTWEGGARATDERGSR